MLHILCVGAKPDTASQNSKTCAIERKGRTAPPLATTHGSTREAGEAIEPVAARDPITASHPVHAGDTGLPFLTWGRTCA